MSGFQWMIGIVMPSRRQEKIARVVRESVSDTISNRLNDPRIEGFVSVTEVDVSPDLRNAVVFLSVMSGDESSRRKTFYAIEHATRHIQARLSHRMTSRFCPRLHFREDTKIKNTLDTLKIIEKAAKELEASNSERLEVEDSD